MSDDNPRSYNLSLSKWIIRVRRWGRKMAEVMATISRSLHENGLETCQPSPSVYDFTCCNGAIGKHIHAYALRSTAHLRFACYSFFSLITDTSEQESSNYFVICNQKNSDLMLILIIKVSIRLNFRCIFFLYRNIYFSSKVNFKKWESFVNW